VKKIRAAAVQIESDPGNKAANLAKIRDFVRQAERQGVEMVAFPECCITGYWFLRHLTHDELVSLASLPDTFC